MPEVKVMAQKLLCGTPHEACEKFNALGDGWLLHGIHDVPQSDLNSETRERTIIVIAGYDPNQGKQPQVQPVSLVNPIREQRQGRH